MRLFVFTKRYPVPYKPYYDAQFADFIRRGHDLTIFSGGSLDGTLNEKVLEYALDRRTHRYPGVLRGLPSVAVTVSGHLARRPRRILASATRMFGQRRELKRYVIDLARMGVVNGSEPDLCLVHGLGTALLFRWLPLVYPDVPTVMYYHGGEVPSRTEADPDEVAVTFRAMDRVFTNTPFSRRHAIDRGCPPEKVTILPVGFWLDDFEAPSSKRRDGPLRVLSAGRMSEEKGFIYALEALDRLVRNGVDDVRYSLTGEGYIRPRLQEFVQAHGLERFVRFLGTLSTEQVLDEMRRSHVLVLPSIQVRNWVENQACAVQEAMLMRCLVVTTRTGGVPDSIPECMKPFSVPPGDAPALADALARIRELEWEERERLADECRAFVVETYDIRDLNERLLSAAAAAKPAPGEATA